MSGTNEFSARDYGMKHGVTPPTARKQLAAMVAVGAVTKRTGSLHEGPRLSGHEFAKARKGSNAFAVNPPCCWYEYRPGYDYESARAACRKK